MIKENGQQEADPASNYTDLLKKVTMEDVIYLAAKALEEMQPSPLQMSWQKLWPNMQQENEQSNNKPANDAEFFQVFQQLEGCAKVEENYISERINSDISQVLNKNKIITVCTANVELQL